MANSYYFFIDGKRYDAGLVKHAKASTRGQGDGRISKNDAQELWRLAMDGGRITQIEENTLIYLLEAFNWTPEAREWMETEMKKETSKTSDYSLIDAIVRHEFELEQLAVQIDREALRAQLVNFSNEVDFPEALRKALDSLFEYDGRGSLRHLVMNVFELFPGVENWEMLLERKIRELLNTGSIVLLTKASFEEEEAADQYPPPTDGETLPENWIFGLQLREFSDHGIWVVVPRDGASEAYNYTFN